MVDMTHRTHVQVGFGSIKMLFCHYLFSPQE